MAAQSFKEWFDIVTDVGEVDPFSGFTSKGVAHIGWDAAIKSLEGKKTSAQQLKAEIAALVSKFDHSSIIDCNGDLVWLLKQLRQLSAV